MSAPVIDYVGSFHLELAPEMLWARIERFDRFESWWPWLSQLRVEGNGLSSGVVLHCVVAPPVPYRMAIDVKLVHCDWCRAIDAEVTGDLNGPASFLFRGDGAGTRADVQWSLEMMSCSMRLADRVLHPLFCWGHDRVVETTLTNFCRHAGED